MSGGEMDKRTVLRTLNMLKELKGPNTFYDLHVHPFEVMYKPFEYSPSSVDNGLFSIGSSGYVAPQVGDVNLGKVEGKAERKFEQKLRAKATLLNARRIYTHTGPKVLGDQMELCAIDKALLLPIVVDEDSGAGQLRSMKEMFGADDRFSFGYCLPNNIPNDKIAADVKRAKDEYGIKVLKIHPAVTGIDLSSPKGIARVESILDASKKSKLKVIIHGGMSPDCKNRQAASYGTVNNLQHIDWSITPETVVIAHCGCFGHSAGEARETVLPIIEQLLGWYSNLAVDTSGIGFGTLCQVLTNIDSQRIMFGSDSLYEQQWAAIVKLWCALERWVTKPEEELLRIVSNNPANFLCVEKGNARKVRGLVTPDYRSGGGPGNFTHP